MSSGNKTMSLHSLSHLLGSSIRYCLVTSSSLINHSYLALTSAILCWRCSRIFSLALKHITSCQPGKSSREGIGEEEKKYPGPFSAMIFQSIILTMSHLFWKHMNHCMKSSIICFIFIAFVWFSCFPSVSFGDFAMVVNNKT